MPRAALFVSGFPAAPMVAMSQGTTAHARLEHFKFVEEIYPVFSAILTLMTELLTVTR